MDKDYLLLGDAFASKPGLHPAKGMTWFRQSLETHQTRMESVVPLLNQDDKTVNANDASFDHAVAA